MPGYWQIMFALSFLSPLLALRADRIYRRMPALPQQPADIPLPSLSIIIPARNEEENLLCLLPSLQAIQYNGQHEIIVVDDNSTDDTAKIAESFGARVLQLKELPPDWLGKPNACHQGAQIASGAWLLFTDADTIHASEGPAKAVTYALENNLDGLSLFPTQETSGFLDRLGLMVAFAGLFSGLDSNHPTLNGQYVLSRRKVYENSGGFSAVRNVSMEDLALGQHLHKAGYHVPIMRGDDAATVQMYRSRGALWQGLNRLGADSLRWSGKGALITVFLITATMTPFLTIPAVLLERLGWLWLPAMWLAASVGFIPWAQRFGSTSWALLAPAGALFVQVAAVWGLVRRVLRRGIRWKGRMV